MPEDHGPSTDQPMPTSIAPAPEGLAAQHQAPVEREPEPALVPGNVDADPEADFQAEEAAEIAAVPSETSSLMTNHHDSEESETDGEEAEGEAPAEMEPRSAPQASLPDEAPKPNNKRWYVVKVQSGREESIKEAIERRVRKEGLEDYYGQIVIPVEKITEVKTDRAGKRVNRTKERKLYPGYIMAEVEYNDRVLYLFRETSGVGDFVGATADRDKPPPPMTDREILRILGPKDSPEDGPVIPPKPRNLEVGDRVKVADGTFKDMEGEVKEILEAVGKVRVELTIFGRPVPVELEYYQVEQA